MCFSERVSWLTLVIGTVVNATAIALLQGIDNVEIIIPVMLIVGWQYALLMQIPDALAWRHPKATYPGKLAFGLNTTQPLVLILLVMVILCKLGKSPLRLVPSILVFGVYAVYVGRAVNQTDFHIYPPGYASGKCLNLNYTWWRKISPVLYVLCMVLATVAIPSAPYVILTLIIYIGTAAITKAFVNTGCNAGSLWCWSVAGAGLATALMACIVTKSPMAGKK